MIDKNGDFFCRTSRKVYWRVYLILLAFIFFVVMGYVYETPPERNVLIGLGIVVFIGVKSTELHRLKHSYRITHHHVIHSHGVASKRIKRILLSSIGDFDLSQTFWQRLFGMGNVHLQHYGSENIMTIKNINRPREFIGFLQEKMSNFSKVKAHGS